VGGKCLVRLADLRLPFRPRRGQPAAERRRRLRLSKKFDFEINKDVKVLRVEYLPHSGGPSDPLGEWKVPEAAPRLLSLRAGTRREDWFF